MKTLQLATEMNLSDHKAALVEHKHGPFYMFDDFILDSSTIDDELKSVIAEISHISHVCVCTRTHVHMRVYVCKLMLVCIYVTCLPAYMYACMHTETCSPACWHAIVASCDGLQQPFDYRTTAMAIDYNTTAMAIDYRTTAWPLTIGL